MSTITPRPARRIAARRASRPTRQAGEVLGHYTDPRGRARELFCRPGASESTLVVDRLAGTLGDERLVAHLAADEPAENAPIVGSLYLADVHGRRCRRLAAKDLATAPFAAEEPRATNPSKDLKPRGDGKCGMTGRASDGGQARKDKDARHLQARLSLRIQLPR